MNWIYANKKRFSLWTLGTVLVFWWPHAPPEAGLPRPAAAF